MVEHFYFMEKAYMSLLGLHANDCTSKLWNKWVSRQIPLTKVWVWNFWGGFWEEKTLLAKGNVYETWEVRGIARAYFCEPFERIRPRWIPKFLLFLTK